MPIKVEWFDTTRTIVRWEFGQHWTVDDYSEAAQQTIEMTQNTPAYYVLAYGPEQVPPEIIKAAMSVHRRAGVRLRFTVAIVSSDYIKLIGRIIAQLPPARSKIYFADDETEALEIIERDRVARAQQRQPPPSGAPRP